MKYTLIIPVIIAALPIIAPIRSFAQVHYYYSPGAAAPPYLTKQWDGLLNVSLGNTGGLRSREYHATLSPYKHLVVSANWQNANQQGVRDNTTQGGSLQIGEISVGGYVTGKYCSSLMVGYGQGDVYNNYGGVKFSQLFIRKIFIQPGITYQNAYLRTGVGLRFNHLEYPKGTSDAAIDEFQLDAIRRIERENPLWIQELLLSGSVRLKPFLVGLNTGFVFTNVDGLLFGRLSGVLSFGFDFGSFAQKKPKKAAK